MLLAEIGQLVVRQEHVVISITVKMARTRLLLIVIALVLALGIVLLRSESGTEDVVKTMDTERFSTQTAGEKVPEIKTTRLENTPKTPVELETEPLKTAVDPENGGKSSSVKLAGLFDSRCQFGVAGHCKEWQVQALACDRGDAESCESLGKMLIHESPMQPLWGSLFLTSACELGRDEICEMGLEWNRWSKFGYRNQWEHDDIPEELQRQCESGDTVACGLIQMRLAKQGKMDEEVALVSCRAGFRDVCTVLFSETLNSSVALRSAKAGCDIPDAYLCLYLGQLYSSDCQELELTQSCPAPDIEQAKHFIALACELEPAMGHCQLR